MIKYLLQQDMLIPLLLVAMLTISACATTTETPVSQAPVGESNSVAESAQTQSESDPAPSEAQADPIALTKLNLNTVNGDELLATIPNFGNRMVREFHEYRPYISIQQFRREIGKYVDEAQVAAYEQYVYVPVNVNESDAETVKQLRGVDDAIAETLMTARPYESTGAFLEKLAEFITADEVAAAAAYLEAE